MKKIYIALSFVLALSSSQAQNNNTKSADKLFDRFEYVNAAKQYLKLTDTGKADTYVYNRLGDCYYNVFNAKESVKWYAKAVEKEQAAETYFRYAQMLKATSKYDEANVQMQKFAALAPNDKRAQNVNNESNYLNKLLGNTKLFEVSPLGINSKNSDFGAYLKDNAIYFVSARNTARKSYEWNNQPFLDLYKVDYSNGSVSGQPTAVASLNTKFHEGAVTISTDGNTLYFSRESFFENEFEKTTDKKSKLGKMFIYKAIKDGDKWIDISSVNLNNKAYNTSSPSLTKDGKTLYFISDRPGSLGKTDVWKAAVNEDGSFGTPENLGPNVNTEGNELSAFIADDNTLYFASNGKQGLGGLDVFAYDTTTGNEAINLGKPVNSEKDDFGFTFNQAQNVAFMSSNRDGGTGDDDVYLATPVCNLSLMVTVRDANSGAMVSDASITMLDEKTSPTSKEMTDAAGKAKLTGECSKPYTLNVEKQGYDSKTVTVDPGKNTVTLAVDLTPTKAIVTEKEVILNEIRFEYNKSNITQDGAFELDKLVAVMNEYPNMVIYAKSHTDNRGSDAYNMSLSDRRAKSTVQYIISKGIAEDRIAGKGFGETEPKVNCGEGCTEEQHAENRRSEFLIVKK
jgi:outer membrane protein OmpA-like peptidoglycan-associated protein/tetratricopeptide (TPR) repeat protein